MDITSAYSVPALTSLVRSMHYDRQGLGALTIRDDVVLKTATTFQAAITTWASVTQVDGGFLFFTQGGEEIYGVIVTPDGYTLTSGSISELPPTLPWTRIGVNLNNPVTKASVVMLFSKLPVVASGVTTTATLTGICNPNGNNTMTSFQYGTAPSYGSRTKANSIGNGSSGVTFAADLSGLLAGTTYHYRSVATTESDSTFGPNQIFTTVAKANQTPPPVVSVPSNQTVEATSGSGAVVNFVTSALDGNDGVVATTDAPASGSTSRAA